MTRNRKHQSAAVRFGPAIKVLLLCLFLVFAGVGYVWQKNQLVDLGRRKEHLEGRLRLLREQTQQVERKLMELQSPAALELSVRKFKLGLVRIESDKIIRLPEPLPATAMAVTDETLTRDRPRDRNPIRGGLVSVNH